MTLSEFIAKWNGKFVEVAGTPNALNQCTDLANQYIREVLGLPIIEWTNAVDFPLKAGDKYDYILNTPEGVPQEGDLVVWQPSPGHIAIFMEGDANRFKSFDQNFPIGSPCHVQEHTYQNVTGWLRAKQATPDPLQVCNQRLGELQEDSERKRKVIEDRDKEISDLKLEVESLTAQGLNWNAERSQFLSKFESQEAEIQDLKNQNAYLQQRIDYFWNEFTWKDCLGKAVEKFFKFLREGK